MKYNCKSNAREALASISRDPFSIMQNFKYILWSLMIIRFFKQIVLL